MKRPDGRADPEESDPERPSRFGASRNNIYANARGRGRGGGLSEGEEEEWRRIREPIMEILSRSSSALDVRRARSSGRRDDPDPDDPEEDDQKEDASGKYSSCSIPQEDPMGLRQPLRHSAAASTNVGGGHRRGSQAGDMMNHPKMGTPKKDKDSDLDAFGGTVSYAEGRSRVRFANHVFRGPQPQAQQQVQQTQLQQHQQHQSPWNNTPQDAGGGNSPTSYNISASLNNRRQSRNNHLKHVAILATVTVFVVAFTASYVRDFFMGENGDSVRQKQRSTLAQQDENVIMMTPLAEEGVMDVVNDIPLRQIPGETEQPEGIAPSNLRGYFSNILGGLMSPEQQEQQLQIQNDVIQIQNEIMDAQARTILDNADVASTPAKAVADVVGEVASLGGRAKKLQKERAREEAAYRAAMDRQAREEMRAQKEEEEEERAQLQRQREQQQQHRAAGAEVEAEEGEGAPSLMTEAEIEAARLETKAMLEESRRKAAEEEEARVAREASTAGPRAKPEEGDAEGGAGEEDGWGTGEWTRAGGEDAEGSVVIDDPGGELQGELAKLATKLDGHKR